MKKYKVLSRHDIISNGVCMDRFDIEHEVQASTPDKAIKKFCLTNLKFRIKDSQILEGKKEKTFKHDFITDEYLKQSSQKDITKWENGTLDLYINKVTFLVFELNEVEI